MFLGVVQCTAQVLTLLGSLALDGEPGRKQVLRADKPDPLPSEGTAMGLSPQLLL